MIKKISVAAALALLVTSNMASAAYVSLDWQTEGDGLAFLDEDAGLEWLQLTQTDSMSLNEVLSELEAGGIFEGWRLATASEVSSLATEMTGYSTKQNINDQTENNESVTELYEDFSEAFGWLYTKTSGSSWDVHYDYRSYGLYLDGDNVLMSGVRWRKNPQSSTETHYSSYSYVDYDSSVTNYTTSFSDESYGVFLVGDGGATLSTQKDMSLVANNPIHATSVPEPTGIALFGAGLLGLGVVKKTPTHNRSTS